MPSHSQRGLTVSIFLQWLNLETKAIKATKHRGELQNLCDSVFDKTDICLIFLRHISTQSEFNYRRKRWISSSLAQVALITRLSSESG